MDELREIVEYSELILKFREDQITDDELQRFKTFLRTNANARRIYVETLIMHSVFQGRKSAHLEIDTSFLLKEGLDEELWKELADYEKNADGIEIVPIEAQSNTSLPKIEKQRIDRTVSKSSLLTFIASAAAIVLIFLYIRFVPPRQFGSQVAVLSDSMNAQWADADGAITKGSFFATSNKSLLLRQGYAELLFNNQAKITVEGPAEFQILTEDQIKLNYGRIYAMVPREAIGFTVKTPSSQIIDLGTEFGVEADFYGDSSLHVINGKTMLIAGDKSNKVSMEVSKGIAKKVSLDNQTISAISCDDRLFVRDIDSSSKLAWRGQTKIDLADIVGEGNGFNSGVLNSGIDAATGTRIPRLIDNGVLTGAAGYKIVNSSPYIDGVFFPGTEENTQITSDGSAIVQFPRTSGLYWGYIFNGAFHYGNDVPKHDLILDGMVFGRPDNPAITIHPNQGITFDLSEIRKTIPVGKIIKFCSLIGISETVQSHGNSSSAVFWVFVDGKKVCEQKMSNADKAIQLDIPIAATDRFLTLAVTESDDTWSYDWTLFGRPELILESTP